jgi:hypothetical protein
VHKRAVLLAVAVLLFWNVSAAVATPITITQTFGPALSPLEVNGVCCRSVSGDWVFTVVTDTTAPDLDPGDPSLGIFAASVTVSNSGLGLVDVGVISSQRFYYEAVGLDHSESGIRGLGFNQGGASLVGAAGVLGNPNVIEPAFLAFNAIGPVGSFFNFGPGGNLVQPLVLANRTTVSSQSIMASGAQSVGAVPEPTSLLLFGTGLIGTGVRRYRQRAQGSSIPVKA